MTDAVLILTVGLFFIFGFRMMSRLDRFIASMRGRDPNRSVYVKNMPLLRKAVLLYISGESLRNIFADPAQRREEKNGQFHEQEKPSAGQAHTFQQGPHTDQR